MNKSHLCSLVKEMNKIKLLLLFCLSLILSEGFSQFPGMRSGQNMNVGQFYGKVVDSAGKALGGATVQLVQSKLDSVSKKKKDYIIATILANKKGEFIFEGLSVMSSYRINISALGYKKLDKKVGFEMNTGGGAQRGDFSSMLNGASKDLGNIRLEQDAKQLENVTVTSSKPLFQLYADKKVYNVERDLTATGGTGIDALKNVPSVNVDMDGNVTMRNSSPQIFVDGRPTTLALDQIPADQISTIEVISNPSAKYDASGGGGGILNIVLKKNRKKGYNGNVRSSIDSRARPGFGGDFNFRQNKLNFSLAGYSGFRKTIVNGSSDRYDFLPNDKTAHFYQTNNPIGRGQFGYLRTSMDYFIDNRNTITINGNIGGGNFKNKDRAILNYDTTGSSISHSATRETSSEAYYNNYGTGLSFKHNFTKTGKEWTADANLNFNNNNNSTDFNMLFGYPNGRPDTYQRAAGGGNTRFYTFQTDYVNPITAEKKIEMGARMAMRNFNNAAENYFKAPTGDYVYIPGFGTTYRFEDQTLAAYFIHARQLKKMNYQVGLRAEYYNYKGLLVNENQSFTTKYPLSLFPSLNMTFKLNDKEDMQFNYSRKVNRPGFFQLMPFVDSTDFLNISVGNPDLQPEFTNIIELVFAKQYGTGQSFIGTLYGKLTENLITRYQYRDDKFNPSTDSVLVTTFGNASNSYTVGLELTGKNKITKWWDLTSNLNLFHINMQAGNLPGTEASSRFSWFVKLNNSFKLPRNFSIQVTGDYQAKTLLQQSGGRSFMGGGGMFFGGGGGGFGGNQPTAQGYIRAIWGMDIAIKKEFLKNNAASLTLQCSDIFASRTFSTHSESIFFVQDNYRLRDPQIFRLSFNWRFGKLDVSLFKRKNLKGDMENMQNMQNMMGP